MLEKKYQKISFPSIREALIRKNLKKYGLLPYRGAGNKKNAAPYFLFRCGDTAEKSD